MAQCEGILPGTRSHLVYKPTFMSDPGTLSFKPDVIGFGFYSMIQTPPLIFAIMLSQLRAH